MERKALFWNREFGAWAFSYLLDFVAGYGERPIRTLRFYAFVILAFAACFYAISNKFFPLVTTDTNPLSVIEAFVLSITSFHGRGIFQSSHSLGDPIGFMAAIEAVCGLFIEAIFVATFSRRFLSD